MQVTQDMAKNGTTYYGFQAVDGWTEVVVSGDNSNTSYPNSAMGGAVFAYGSEFQMKGNNVGAPAAGPTGNAGQCLGFFGVWSSGGYYYQEVTLSAGDYTIEIPVYSASGTNATTSYFGFIPASGTSQTMDTPTTTGSWQTLSKSFTLTDVTVGKICVGYKSNGSNSGANPMLFIDQVKILFTAISNEDLAAAKLAEAQEKLNKAINTASDLVSSTEKAVGTALFAHPFSVADALDDAITTAEGTLANETDPDKLNDATAILNAAVDTYKTTINAPAKGDAYGLVNKNTGFYLNFSSGVTITEDSYAIQFIANGTGWTIASISNEEVTLGMAGNNTWSLSNNKITAWTLTPTIYDDEVTYTIQGPYGLIGTDKTDSGSTCYGDKGVSNNGEWFIVKIDAAGIAKSALAAAIATASDYANSNAAGDAPLYHAEADFKVFETAISDAQAVYDNEEASIAELEAATTAISTALATYKATEVNPIDLTKKYIFINVSDGYGKQDYALTFKSASTADLTANTTSMGYTELPGSVYPQAVTLTAVDDVENGFTFSYTRADGNTIYASTGKTSGLGSSTSQIRPTTDETKALTIQLQPTTTVGVYKLYNTEASNTIGANGTNDTGFYTTSKFNDFKMIEAVENVYALDITAANQYATAIVPFDAEVPDGAKAYVAAKVDDNEVVLEEAATLKANTPYVVYAEEGISTKLAGLGAAYTDATYTEGLLTGAHTEFSAPVGSYVLQNQEDAVKFYVVEGEAKTVTAGHAYLTTPVAEVKALGFSAITTAIKNIEVAKAAQNGAIFNLAGQQLSGLQKGINIVNGKKVLVK